MSRPTGKMEVVILGTMHLEPEAYPSYGQRLREIIEEVGPDVICAEVSPEQLAGTQPCNSKPEQRDVVLPTAARLGIAVVPIQLPTALALEWQSRYRAVDDALRKQEPQRYYLQYSEALSFQEAELWREMMKSGVCIENVQLTEYHVFAAARDAVERQLLPERDRLLTEWNESFLKRIEEVIATRPGSLLMVIAGLWHKHWLWNRLRERDDVEVCDLQSYRRKRAAKTANP